MCVMSAVHDNFYDRWNTPYTQPFTFPQIPTQAEIDEFRELLEKARKQDEEEGNADCGTEEKKNRVRELLLSLAAEFDLEIEITFLDEF